MNTLTQKQINFTLDVFGEIEQGKAYMTHYKVKSQSVADAAAARLLRNVKIQAYLQELRDQATSSKVAARQEVMEVLTEQLRGRPTDFMTCSVDGVWFYDIGPETFNKASLKKIKTSTITLDKESDTKVIVTDLELYDPGKAAERIASLMGWTDTGTTINVDNRQVIFQGVDKETQKLIEELGG